MRTDNEKAASPGSGGAAFFIWGPVCAGHGADARPPRIGGVRHTEPC